MCLVINDTTERKLYSHKQSEVNTQYVNFTHEILQITETKVKQLVTKRKYSNRWQCMRNVTSFTITLPQTNIELSICTPEILWRWTSTNWKHCNIFVLPMHEIFLSWKFIQMYKLIIMVHVGTNFSKFFGMKTFLKLERHTWVSLQLYNSVYYLHTHTHFIYILVFGLYYIKVWFI
jgi:hypothetical protein